MRAETVELDGPNSLVLSMPSSRSLIRPLVRELHAYVPGEQPKNINVGNGSDELLALAVRCFVEPEGRVTRVPRQTKSGTRITRPSEMVQYFTPSYSLYPVLADIQGAAKAALPLNPDFSLPSAAELKRGRVWNSDAALTF